MAINTRGYSVQLPPIAVVPSNIGHIDVAGAYDLLRGSRKNTEEAAKGPADSAENIRNLRTLLGRAAQEDALRKLETQSKAALLQSQMEQAPLRTRLLSGEVERSPMQTSLLGQRVRSGARGEEIDIASQPAKLLGARMEGENVGFQSTIPVEQRVLGIPKTMESRTVITPAGEVETEKTTSAVVGDKAYRLSTEAASKPLEQTKEQIIESDKPGYMKVVTTDAQGNVLSEKHVPNRATFAATIGDMHEQASNLIAQAKEAKINGDMTLASELEARADTLYDRASQFVNDMKASRSSAGPTAASRNAAEIASLESKANRTPEEDAKLKALRAQVMSGVEKENVKAQKFKQAIEGAFGGEQQPAKQAGKFKILEVK